MSPPTVITVLLAEDEYRLDEDGTVTVCVQRMGSTTEDISLTLTTAETSPPSATGPSKSCIIVE